MKSKSAPPDIRKILFEPVGPYFADAYTTLTSVVQGLALGILGFQIATLYFDGKGADIDLTLLKSAVTLKLFLVFLLICLMWHRYIVHNQFYAWQLGVEDTIIPLTFGILEVLLILAAPKALIYSAFLFACVSTLGIFAYVNTIQKHRDPPENPKALAIYKEHFHSLGTEFGAIMFDEVTRYERRAQQELIVSSLVLWSFWALLCCDAISSAYQHPLYFCICGAILGRMLVAHLWRHLRQSVRLKEYWLRAKVESE